MNGCEPTVVDGLLLTDGGLWQGLQGKLIKRFDMRDVLMESVATWRCALGWGCCMPQPMRFSHCGSGGGSSAAAEWRRNE